MHKFGLRDGGDWSGIVVRAVYEEKGMGDAPPRTGSPAIVSYYGTHFTTLPRTLIMND